MRLLDRYLFRCYLPPVAYCLSAFSMIFVIYDLFDRLSKFIEAHTPLALIAKYYVFLLLPTLEYITPASLLLATLYTLWHLARNNEIIAMQANGVSFLRIMAPFLAVGVAFSLANMAVKETLAARAVRWTAAFSRDLSRAPGPPVQFNTAYYNSRDRRLWLIEAFDPTRPTALRRVKITEERPDGTRLREIFADKAEWLDRHWVLRGVREQWYGANDQPVTGGVAHAVWDASRLTEKPTEFLTEISPWEMLSTRRMLRYLRRHPNLSPATLAQKRYDLHSRTAMPWACLVVTFFAIPTGAGGRRQGPLTGIFLAVACFFGFYALNQVGLFLGKRMVLSPWLGAWLSNIVFFLAGVVMIVRRR